MKKLLLLLGVTAATLILNASEPKVGHIVQNDIHKQLIRSWDDTFNMGFDDEQTAFQIYETVSNPEIRLTMPQRNESVWINPDTKKYEPIMNNSLILKTSDNKFRLIVGVFIKGSIQSKKMYKALVDTFGKKNIKIIGDIQRDAPFSNDRHKIFDPINEIKKDKYWGIAG